MNRKLLVALLVLAALIAGPWYGARQSVQAMEQGREHSGLALNLAYWAVMLPGMSALVDVPRTALAVAYHQHRDGAELADTAQMLQRAERLQFRLQSWLDKSPLNADGSIDSLRLQAQQQMLGTLVRLDRWPGTLGALAPRLQQQLAATLQAPSAAALEPLQRLRVAETLAMFATRQHDAAQAERWLALAEQAVPQPVAIKEQTTENTARHLLRLRAMLASCAPGKTPLFEEAANTALRQGYDVRQLRAQYTAGWDRALLLLARRDGTSDSCRRVADDYQRLLTAAQPSR